MSDRIALMNEGQVIQLGSPAELYERPRTRFVAQFLGGCNLLAARVKQRSGSETIVETSIGEVRIRTADTRNEFTLAVRPEKIVYPGNGAMNSFAAEIIETAYAGAETHSIARVGPETLRIATVNTAANTPVRVGTRLHIMLPAEALIILED
jgi:ABC-type Fe3+/spermidine/putrescine transport system ATPase subunit